MSNETENNDLIIINPSLDLSIPFMNKALEVKDTVEIAKTFLIQECNKETYNDFIKQRAILESIEKDFKLIATGLNRPLNNALDTIKEHKDRLVGVVEKYRLGLSKKIDAYATAEQEKQEQAKRQIQEEIRKQEQAKREAEETLKRQQELEKAKIEQAQALFGDDEVVEKAPAPNVIEAERVVAEANDTIVEAVQRLEAQDISITKNIVDEVVLKDFDISTLDLDALRHYFTDNALKVALNQALKRNIQVTGAIYETIKKVK